MIFSVKNCFSENQQSELERWKNLATERLNKMEQLSAQLKERHTQEVSIKIKEFIYKFIHSNLYSLKSNEISKFYC